MSDSFIDKLVNIVGQKYLVTDHDLLEPYIREYRGRYIGKALAVVKPCDTKEVSEIVQLCDQHAVQIVPQGGNTSLVGGSISYNKNTLIINLSRLNDIRDIDVENFSITVGAGCILSTVQKTADDHDLYFPMTLGSQGSCQIGGNIASNAGGMLTVKYGNMRDLVLGLEVVLPSGEIWHGLRRLRKDNTGYDLKHLFIGSEGSLGIITAAVLKLYSKPTRHETFFAGLKTPNQAVTFFKQCRKQLGEQILAFELIPRLGIDLSLKHVKNVIDPLNEKYPWYVLCEFVENKSENETLRTKSEALLSALLENDIICDGVFAETEVQRKQLWFIREAITEAERMEGASIKHDISVPISKIPEFLTRATTCVQNIMPDIRPVPFGHLGDGNLHFNLTQPKNMKHDIFLEYWDSINQKVHDIVDDLGGSIAAEHGIGTFKRDELARRKSNLEIDLMRQIKKTLDPNDIMNPDVILKTNQ